jgi:hypothetical protein
MGERLRWGFREKVLDIRDWLDFGWTPTWWVIGLVTTFAVLLFAKLPQELRILVGAATILVTGLAVAVIFLWFVGLAIVNGLEAYFSELMPIWRERLHIGSARAGAIRIHLSR